MANNTLGGSSLQFSEINKYTCTYIISTGTKLCIAFHLLNLNNDNDSDFEMTSYVISLATKIIHNFVYGKYTKY